MKIFTIIIIVLVAAGLLVRIIRILRREDGSDQTIRKQQLGQIAITLFFGFLMYFLILMYADDTLRRFSILIGIPLLGLQGGRFAYKYMQLRKMKKEGAL